MSVGQSKSLRAHQHKMNTKIGRAKTAVEELKARNIGKPRHRHKYEVLTSTIKQGVIIGQTCRCVECGIVRVESNPKAGI